MFEKACSVYKLEIILLNSFTDICTGMKGAILLFEPDAPWSDQRSTLLICALLSAELDPRWRKMWISRVLAMMKIYAKIPSSSTCKPSKNNYTIKQLVIDGRWVLIDVVFCLKCCTRFDRIFVTFKFFLVISKWCYIGLSITEWHSISRLLI